MSDARIEADKLAHEAKSILKSMFGIREGESNGQVERIVDCIVMACMLQCTEILNEVATELICKKE